VRARVGLAAAAQQQVGGAGGPDKLDRERAPAALGFADLLLCCCRHRFDRQSPQWPLVGIFAQRGKGRPDRLGLSVCRLLAVDELTVTVQALDAIDGAPVLDLKPYMSEFAPRSRVTQPALSRELMAGCWDASSATGPCLPDMTKETTSLLTPRFPWSGQPGLTQRRDHLRHDAQHRAAGIPVDGRPGTPGSSASDLTPRCFAPSVPAVQRCVVPDRVSP